ncbi:MAG: cysteine desulfurase family protein, partial [Paludibacter sp.]
MKKIYLDNAATTPLRQEVIAEMMQVLQNDFGNPSSTHSFGRSAKTVLETSRKSIAKWMGCNAQEIIFTSNATEATNWILKSAVKDLQVQRIITSKVEHHATLYTVKHLQSKYNIAVDFVNIIPTGAIDMTHLVDLLAKEGKTLVTLMHVNNEIGVIQDIDAIGQLLKDKGVIFHVDAAQSAGKLPINLQKLPIDLMSLSAHKNYGPKGVGALYVRHKPRIRIQPQSFGGGQEGGLRAGTLPTHQIVGMGEAFELSEAERIEEQARLLALRQHLWAGISMLPGIHLNGSVTQRVAGNLNVSFSGIDGATLL